MNYLSFTKSIHFKILMFKILDYIHVLPLVMVFHFLAEKQSDFHSFFFDFFDIPLDYNFNHCIY